MTSLHSKEINLEDFYERKLIFSIEVVNIPEGIYAVGKGYMLDS